MSVSVKAAKLKEKPDRTMGSREQGVGIRNWELGIRN
jgi:hypothetical protein